MNRIHEKFTFFLGVIVLIFGMFSAGYAFAVQSAPVRNILVGMAVILLTSSMLLCAGLGMLHEPPSSSDKDLRG